jgi:toxin-antitoxin system PIN domain toxin
MLKRMIIPDANLLLYATNSQSPFYEEARSWWKTTLEGTRQVGFCGPAIFSFIRVSTHPGVYLHPLSVEQAFDFVDNWTTFPQVQWLIPDDNHLSRVKSLLLKAGTGGNLVTDAQIAAYGEQYDATVYSADLDFMRFRVKWHNPLPGQK